MNRNLISLTFAAAMLIATTGIARAYSDVELIDGFNKTVFGAEYSSPPGGSYVHKFSGPVRFYVRSPAGEAAKAKVQTFIMSLSSLIYGLDVQLVRRESEANFVVHIVRRKEYSATVRQQIYKDENVQVLGRCMVRSRFSSAGISRSDAVIVADEGANLLSRCMTEEILQGLGPLNDDRSLKASMFNDTSRYTSFRRFDRFILNMLYDSRIKNGATPAEVAPLMPAVLQSARRRIEGR